MTEDEAREWIGARFGAGAVDRLTAFLAMVVEENQRQNLIAPSTVAMIWARHAVDSAQLALLASDDGLWLDIGTGGGFPGLVVALIRDHPTLLVEPRRRRANFLLDCVDRLGLAHRVTVEAVKVERIAEAATVISARAVASVENILRAAAGCATSRTRWLLPRGQIDEADVAMLQRRWRGMFHMEQSITNPQSTILVLEGGMLA